MKLGILVNTDRHLDDIMGLTHAAHSRGDEVIIFVMDEGTRLLESPLFIRLCRLEGVTISFCDHSAQGYAVNTAGLPQTVVCGSQYNNAAMVHNADKVIVL